MEHQSDGVTNCNWCSHSGDLMIRGHGETTQTTPAKILRRVLETWGDLLSLRPSADAGVKTPQKRKINNWQAWRRMWSIWNCATDLHLNILVNGFCTDRNPPERMRSIKFFWDFEMEADHLHFVRRQDLVLITKKIKSCNLLDFAIPANHKVKMKEGETRDKYIDLS